MGLDQYYKVAGGTVTGANLNTLFDAFYAQVESGGVVNQNVIDEAGIPFSAVQLTNDRALLWAHSSNTRPRWSTESAHNVESINIHEFSYEFATLTQIDFWFPTSWVGSKTFTIRVFQDNGSQSYSTTTSFNQAGAGVTRRDITDTNLYRGNRIRIEGPDEFITFHVGLHLTNVRW